MVLKTVQEAKKHHPSPNKQNKEKELKLPDTTNKIKVS